MKSLEIVNSAEKDLKILIDLIKQNSDYDFSLATRLNNERLIRVCESLINSMSNPIKQDLEILEIIRKHSEIHIWQNIFSKEHELEVDIILNHIDNEEERNKVKQWLEGNENV